MLKQTFSALLKHQKAAIFQNTLKYSAVTGSSKLFPTPNVKQLPVHVRERLHQAEDRHGFIPNFLQAYARRPQEFLAYFDYHDALMTRGDGNLTRAEKEMIALVTNAEQNCMYCAVVHAGLHRKYSQHPDQAEQLITNWKEADISAREKAILSYTVAAREYDNESLMKSLENLEKHGLDEEDAWDIVAIMALSTMSGYMARFMGVHPNREFFKMGKK